MSATVTDVAVVRAGLSPVMVGRTAELRRLQALTVDVADPRVALVNGEAGVGKSRLVREFVASLGGFQVFVGHAEPDALGRPFHVVQSALESAVAGWTAVPPPLESRAHALRVLLAPVAAGLAGNDVPGTRVVGEENLAAAVDLFRCLLDGHPGVLVAEDLHWADAESLRLIGRLATTPDLPLVLLGTFRPAVAQGRRVADLLDHVGRQRMVEQIELRPLTENQVAEWLGAVFRTRVPRRVATDLTRRTSGNPFFLEELVASAPDSTLEELCCLPLPLSISEAVLRHLDGLDADQRRIVDAAAVLGRRIPFDLLAAVTGAGEEELIDTMRSIVDRGLVVEIEPDVFTFKHALTREAVAHRLLGRQRRRLHEKAHAALLETGSDDWGALAYHASGANLWDDVIEAARRGAAVHLRTGSTYEALRLAELGLCEAEADFELLFLSTRAAWACGLTDSAISYATQWTRLAESSGDDAQLSRALRAVSRLRWETGDEAGRDKAIERLLAVADRLPDGADLAAVYGHVAEVRMLAGRSAEAVEWADRALALLNEGADDEAWSAALVNKGSALLDMPGHFDAGCALLLEAIDAAESRGDVLSALRAVNNLVQGALVRWPADQVHALIDRRRALVEKWGWHDWDWSLAEAEAAFQSQVVGDADAARAVLDAALAEPLADRNSKRIWLLAERAWLAADIGDPDTAALLDEVRAWQLANAAKTRLQPDWVECLEIEIAARANDRAGVVAALERLEANVVGNPTCTLHSWTWGTGLLGALRAGVEPDRVRRVLQSVLASPTLALRDEDEGWQAHVEAAIAAVEGDHARAVDAYRAALAQPRRRPGVVVDADVQIGLARSLIALGRLDDARACVDEAARLLNRWRGWRVRELEVLRHRLATGGTRVASGELTARERDVAALVAQGLSNGEIGRKLFISTKTASVHVSNILAKLHMVSRSQIAAWASSQGSE